MCFNDSKTIFKSVLIFKIMSISQVASLDKNLDFKFKNVSGKNLKFETNALEDSLTVFVYDE